MDKYDVKLWDTGRGEEKLEEQDRKQLLEAIRKAHADWVSAQFMFDYALHPDEIDQAIYLLNAAEKRFDMLYKLAKRAQLSVMPKEGGASF